MIRRKRQYTDNFTIVDNRPVNDSRLSWAARGVLTYLLSKPDNWQVRVSHLASPEVGNLRKDAIHKILNELIECGYASRRRIRRPGGTMGPVEYDIFDVPLGTVPPQPDSPDVVSPDVVCQDAEQVHDPSTATVSACSSSTVQQIDGAPQPDSPDVVQPEPVNPQLLSTDTNQVLNKPRGEGADALPAGLNLDAWNLWQAYRRKRKMAKLAFPERIQAALAKLSEIDQLTCVEYSTNNNYVGLFPDRFATSKARRGSQQKDRVEELIGMADYLGVNRKPDESRDDFLGRLHVVNERRIQKLAVPLPTAVPAGDSP